MFFSLCIYSIVLVLLSVKHLRHFYETKQSQQPNSTSDIAEPQSAKEKLDISCLKYLAH